MLKNCYTTAKSIRESWDYYGKKIYHGSNVEVSVPRILQNGFYKDFGYGFYCTVYEKQAKRWAITRKGDSI